ncbi:hypothetical protein [Nostoc sp. FACHB-110]|uniref:hypothetical protein n=1 Tax=Nostoc sp. FACHB-110 TaxID=2692834 RepID=UPI001682542B|nr:hypothetical protein [Nostoc sp. FACHB-110]MBD2440930.1 hypothetical protein [Nostoc sp. FACHB-110]
MSGQKIYRLFLAWLKITLPTFVGLSAIIVLLLVLFTILQVPSFVLGNDTFWLLRWRYEQNANFAIAFNPFLLFGIASIIGFIGMYLKRYSYPHSKRRRN